MPRVLASFESDRAKARRAVDALAELIFLDLELGIFTYFASEDERAVT